MRVVSLLPSATEIVVGLDPAALVGRSHECDFPDGLGAVPTLTDQATRYDPARGVGAGEIDRVVRERLSDGGSLYTLDTDLLKNLKPDLVVTQDLCSVCSIDLGAVRSAAESLNPRPEILSLNPQTLEDVLDDVLRVGLAIDREARAQEWVVRLRDRLFRAQEYVPAFGDAPVVGFLEWTDPLFVAGHWTVQMIERAGGSHPLNPTVAKPGTGEAIGPQQAERIAGKSIAVPAELFASSAPEWLVIAPCGLNLEQALAAARELAEDESTRGWFASLPAVRAGRVAVVDGNQFFNRPGPRLVDALEWLVSWVQERPELEPDGFAWERFGA